VPTLVIANVAAVSNPEGMAEYRARVLDTLQRYGGGFYIRGGEVEVLEGGWHPGHLSIIAFPTMAHARRWYESPEYRELLPLRDGVELDLVFVEGRSDGLENGEG
jgi:uncharacterized protein (DUF1330 family)